LLDACCVLKAENVCTLSAVLSTEEIQVCLEKLST